MQVSMFPSAPHDPWTVMLPNSRFAVSSFPRGDRAEVAVANLITGEHRRLADLQIDVIVSGDANGWQAIGEFDILPTANGIQIIYMLYSETSTGGGYNANIMHGLRAREVVVSTDTVRELFSRSPLTGDRLRGPSTE